MVSSCTPNTKPENNITASYVRNPHISLDIVKPTDVPYERDGHWTGFMFSKENISKTWHRGDGIFMAKLCG